MAVTTELNVGRVESVQGVVVEVVFADKLPEINHAITIKRPAAAAAEEDMDIGAAGEELLVLEVQQHLGDDRVRAVAMDSTDGQRDRRPLRTLLALVAWGDPVFPLRNPGVPARGSAWFDGNGFGAHQPE